MEGQGREKEGLERQVAAVQIKMSFSLTRGRGGKRNGKEGHAKRYGRGTNAAGKKELKKRESRGGGA